MAALASAFVLMPTLALMFVSSPASILVSRVPRAVVKVLLAFAPSTVSVSAVEFVTSALALSVVFAALLRSSSPCASMVGHIDANAFSKIRRGTGISISGVTFD